MKKIITCFLASFGFNAFCQPVLNAADLNAFNIISNVYSAESTTLNAGNFGANVTWNYSSIVLPLPSTETFETVATAPYASNFPTANFFTKLNNSFYGYYNKTATKLEAVGNSEGTDVSTNYIDPETLFTFPFSYNLSFSDTFKESSSTPVGSKVVAYDAYGTVITPYGTYNDCFRFKTTFSGSNYIIYEWYKLNPFRPILIVNTQPTGSTSFDFYQATNLSTDSFKTSKIAVFPNPVSSVLNVAMADNATFSQIVIHDSLGKTIYADNKENTSATIDTDNFSSGVYFVSVVKDGQKNTSKFIKN